MIAVTVAVYAQVGHHEFVSFDDPQYVSDNAQVSNGLTWRGLWWALTTGHAGNWHPITWLSHMLDVQMYGLNAGPHHLTNLLLHVINTLLLFTLLRGMTAATGRSAFVAALFAVHPLHVESVAWVSERKDVLSTMFWMLTLFAYVNFVCRRRMVWYFLVGGFFALGLMAKPMVVTLPFVLLLLDFWPLRRIGVSAVGRLEPGWRRVVAEKLPLLAMAIASGVVALIVQRRGGAVQGLAALPFDRRLANALVSYVVYIEKMWWPSALAAIYPYPRHLSLWSVAGAAATIIGLSVIAVRAARHYPYLPVGWFWYLGTLMPVIGLIQVGIQSRADRYTYIPLIGLFVIVSWGVHDLLGRLRQRHILLTTVATVVICSCAIIARAQVRHWKTSVALWEHTVAVTDDNYRAHEALGSLSAESGRLDEAIAHFSETLRLEPTFGEAHNKLGAALAERNRIEEAAFHYREALRLKPDFAEAHNNLGNALARQGRTAEAVTQYREALRIDPTYADAHNGLGSALDDEGKVEEAISHYSEALRLNPRSAEARNNLAAAFVKEGRLDAAIHELLQALQIRPNQASLHYNVAVILAQRGDIEEARRHLDAALKLDPANVAARRALETVGTSRHTRGPGI